jgi:hypothetical protein
MGPSMRWLAACIAALLWLREAAPAQAYSVANHKRITADALWLLDACKLHAPAAMPKGARKVAGCYNTAQDGLFQKRVHWHFPPAVWYPVGSQERDRAQRGDLDGCEPKCPTKFPFRWAYCGVVRRTRVDAWVDYLWQRARGGTPHEVYAALGATMHYLQDMFVPSHVVPVFHPRPWFQRDAFDSYTQWEEIHPHFDATKGHVPTATCEALRQDRREPIEILRGAIAHTLRALDEPRGVRIEIGGRARWHPWRDFWDGPPHERHAGFLRYGFGGDDHFGDERFHTAGGEARVAPLAYQRFATRRARGAITATAALILRFERELRPCQGPRCAQRRHDWDFIPSIQSICALPGPNPLCGPRAKDAPRALHEP